MFNQSDIDYDLDSVYLGSEITYADIWGCGGTLLTDLSDLGNVNRMCRIAAVIDYITIIGLNATNTVTNFLNNINSFNSNYNAYVEFLQTTITTQYFDWIQKTEFSDAANYFYCTTDPNNINSCVDTVTGGTDSISCSSQTFQGFQLISSSASAAAQSLSTYMNMTINATDFYLPSSFSINPNTPGDCQTIVFKDSSVPSAAQLVPNPLSGINQNNVTSIIQLISSADSNIYKFANPSDLLEILQPVLIFVSVADAADQINQLGAQAAQLLQQQRDEMIITEVFGVLGVVTMFLGPEGVFAQAAIDTAQLFTDLIVSGGQLNVGDVVAVVFDFAGIIFDGLGTSIKDTVNSMKAAKAANSDIEKDLQLFKYYKEVRDTFRGKTCPV
jgi:hypothetical protein